MGILIPLYTYPTDATWAQVAMEARLHPTARLFAIINPNNGVGAAQDPAFTVGVRILQQAGVKVLGYIATGYGRKSLQACMTEASSYANWYFVDGIFWDEFLSGWQAPPTPGLVIGNPGTDSAETSFPLITYEQAGMPARTFMGNYIAHTVPTLPVSYAKPQYYYITNDAATYMVLPSYFSALVAGDAQPLAQTPPPPAPKRFTIITPLGDKYYIDAT